MILQTANGPKEIKVADLDFTNLMCDLEDHDVDVMGLLDDDTRENMKIFKTIRAIIAVLTGTKDLTKAGKASGKCCKERDTKNHFCRENGSEQNPFWDCCNYK